MGCAQSKIENEESVARCKDRRQFMKEAVVSRNAFAAAHVSYIMSLKNTGAALTEYGQAEMVGLHNNHHSTTTGVASSSVTQTPMDNLPPPPPLPVFSPSPLRRAANMPVNSAMRPFSDDLNPTVPNSPMQEGETGGGGLSRNVHQKNQPPPPPPPPVNKGMTWDYFFSMEDDINAVPNTPDEEIPSNTQHVVEKEPEEETPPVTPQKMTINSPLSPPPSHQHTSVQQSAGSTVHLQHGSSTGVLEIKRGEDGTGVGGFVDFLRILNDIDDHFLKGSESAQDVSKMLEATRLHYHSNFADNRGHIDHSARVMRVITWNRSFKGIPYGENNSKDDFDNDKWETHATILDKLLAWEKKLYDEVKAGELMKIEYQRKVGLLSKQKKRGANPETLEKTKAAVSHLHTRYIVDMQSMDSTVSEIQHLRDEQLFPKLSTLVNGMAQMWEAMHINHDKQLKVVLDLRTLNISATQMETTQQHYNKTAQLHQMAMEWHASFQKLVNHHKEYIQALYSWLKLNVIPIESSLKEKVSSPPHVIQPPIQPLLHAWQDQLEKLPEELAKTAIHSFAAVINSIMLHQQEEMKHKDKCVEMNKDYVRKQKAYDEWFSKYGVANRQHHETGSEEVVNQGGDDYVSSQKDLLLEEKKLVVETLKKRVDEENERYRIMCKQVREKSVMSLKTHLPELFRAMSDFSLACFTMYKNLRDIITKNSHH